MSDNSPEDSSIDPALAEAELVTMVNNYLTSPDGVRYLDDRVAPRVADLIRGDKSFFTELLTPMVKDALDSDDFKAKLSQLVIESLKTAGNDTKSNAAPAAPTAATPAKAPSSAHAGGSQSSSKNKNLGGYLTRAAKKRKGDGSTPTTKKGSDLNVLATSDEEEGPDVDSTGHNSDSELERVCGQDDKKKKSRKVLKTPDRYKHWEPIIAELKDTAKYKVGDFTTVRKDRDGILVEVTKHFTKVVADWLQTAIRSVKFPDGKKRTSSNELDLDERLFIRTRLLYRAVVRKRSSLRFTSALNTINGYRTRVDKTNTVWHKFVDEVVEDVIKRGKKTGEFPE